MKEPPIGSSLIGLLGGGLQDQLDLVARERSRFLFFDTRQRRLAGWIECKALGPHGVL
jgi:hypothetical protein